MRKGILLVLLIVHANVWSQSNDYLATYGQVWGFLKYYHPYPSSVDWDQQLLNDFEKVKHADSQSFQQTLDALLSVVEVDSTARANYIAINPTMMKKVFDWMKSENLTASQHKKLNALRLYKPKFKNSYIETTELGTANFETEKSYNDSSIQEQYAYLALTRYWNAINYFFPYRDLIPTDWTEDYVELLPLFLESKTHADFYYSVLQMSSRIYDGHGFVIINEDYRLLVSEKTPKYAPFYVAGLKEGTYISMVAQSDSTSLPFRVGDKIYAINGVDVETRWEEVSKFNPSSNAYTARRSDYLFKRFEEDTISVGVVRNGDTLHYVTKTITQQKLSTYWSEVVASKKKARPAYELRIDSVSGKNYLYVDLEVLERKDVDKDFKKMLRKTNSLVIDVRNYPNWTVLKLCEHLLKGKHHFAHSGRMNAALPGSISWHPTQKVGGKWEYPGDVYILVDRVTQSQAEYTVMALQQHPRAITIGGQTAGADGNVTRIPLPYGIQAAISGIAIVYPDGRQTQQVGIHRDIEVYQDVEYVLYGKDAIINTALKLIREGN